MPINRLITSTLALSAVLSACFADHSDSAAASEPDALDKVVLDVMDSANPLAQSMTVNRRLDLTAVAEDSVSEIRLRRGFSTILRFVNIETGATEHVGGIYSVSSEADLKDPADFGDTTLQLLPEGSGIKIDTGTKLPDELRLSIKDRDRDVRVKFIWADREIDSVVNFRF